MALNRCEFIGNLGQDPEMRTFNNGDKVANLRLAVTEKWKDRNSGERREKTEWIPVSVFGPLAGIAEQYLQKGSKVYVAGKFQTRKWQDQSGNDRYTSEVVLQGFDAKLEMLDGPRDGQRESGQQSDSRYQAGYDAQKPLGQSQDFDDEIPF